MKHQQSCKIFFGLSMLAILIGAPQCQPSTSISNMIPATPMNVHETGRAGEQQSTLSRCEATECVLVGFPGLNDDGPQKFMQELVGPNRKHNLPIAAETIMLRRNTEYLPIKDQVLQAYQKLDEEDQVRFNGDIFAGKRKVVLLGESYGALQALLLALYYGKRTTPTGNPYGKLDVAGVISIHGPLGGVSAAPQISRFYRNWFKPLRIDKVLNYFSPSIHTQMQHWLTLEAFDDLDPKGNCIKTLKEKIPAAKFKILALAGTASEGPMYHNLEKFWGSPYFGVLFRGLSWPILDVASIRKEYNYGHPAYHDGLVTRASAWAECIRIPENFRNFIRETSETHHYHLDFCTSQPVKRKVKQFLNDLLLEGAEESGTPSGFVMQSLLDEAS